MYTREYQQMNNIFIHSTRRALEHTTFFKQPLLLMAQIPQPLILTRYNKCAIMIQQNNLYSRYSSQMCYSIASRKV